MKDPIDVLNSADVRRIMAAAARASSELVADVVDCPVCGRQAGQYCRGSNPDGNSRMPHADRRDAAARWRQDNREEWKRLREDTIRRLLNGRSG